MGSRTWIKIYCERWLNGTIREETPEVRGIWVDLLVLAGSGKYGDSGEIKITDGIGFLDRQLADVLQISQRKWASIKKKLTETDRICVGDNNIIAISNWAKYQSEFERQKVQRHESPDARINYSMGVAIANSLKHGKDGRPWESVVGYTRGNLVKHLEAQFDTKMNWDNYGQWHIDHIVPKSSFHFQAIDEPEFKQCWALNNLQPLWAFDNLSKGASMGATKGAVRGASRDRDRDKRLEKETIEEETKQEESPVKFLKSIDQVMSLYQENILLGATISEEMENEIKIACGRYSPDWVYDAITEAVVQNQPRWQYISGVLKNWSKYGKKAYKPRRALTVKQ